MEAIPKKQKFWTPTETESTRDWRKRKYHQRTQGVDVINQLKANKFGFKIRKSAQGTTKLN